MKVALLATETVPQAQADFRVIVDHDLAMEQVHRDALVHKLFPANEVEKPSIQIDVQSRPETSHESPAGNLPPSVFSTARSARPPISRITSAPRTTGNLTPYPRGASTSSNSAVIGAPRGVTADETRGNKTTGVHQHTISRTNTHQVTSAGPNAIVLKDHGNTEWVAQGLKIDPLKSTVEMSQSSRLVYKNQRLHTLAHAGGGSYAYSAAGRGPIMGLHSTLVPDGLMVRIPVFNTAARPADGIASEQDEKAQPDLGFSVSEKQRPKVLRGDKEANSWHADLASSGMRWAARTRKLAQECFVLCCSLFCCIACSRRVPCRAQSAFRLHIALILCLSLLHAFDCRNDRSSTCAAHLTMPVPSKAVQQDGHLGEPTSYGYDAPSRFQKWAIAGNWSRLSFIFGDCTCPLWNLAGD